MPITRIQRRGMGTARGSCRGALGRREPPLGRAYIKSCGESKCAAQMKLRLEGSPRADERTREFTSSLLARAAAAISTAASSWPPFCLWPCPFLSSLVRLALSCRPPWTSFSSPERRTGEGVRGAERSWVRAVDAPKINGTKCKRAHHPACLGSRAGSSKAGGCKWLHRHDHRLLPASLFRQ